MPAGAGQHGTPWTLDLTPDIIADRTAVLRFQVNSYDLSEQPDDRPQPEEQFRQVVQLLRPYLVLYRPPGNHVSGPTIEVLEVFPGINTEKNGIEDGNYFLSLDVQRLESIYQCTNWIRSPGQRAKNGSGCLFTVMGIAGHWTLTLGG